MCVKKANIFCASKSENCYGQNRQKALRNDEKKKTGTYTGMEYTRIDIKLQIMLSTSYFFKFSFVFEENIEHWVDKTKKKGGNGKM